jgi:hypothetical protein
MYHIRFYVVSFIKFNFKRFHFPLNKQKFPIIAITRNHFAINGTTQGPDVDGALLLLQLELCWRWFKAPVISLFGGVSSNPTAAILLNWVHQMKIFFCELKKKLFNNRYSDLLYN